MRCIRCHTTVEQVATIDGANVLGARTCTGSVRYIPATTQVFSAPHCAHGVSSSGRLVTRRIRASYRAHLRPEFLWLMFFSFSLPFFLSPFQFAATIATTRWTLFHTPPHKAPNPGRQAEALFSLDKYASIGTHTSNQTPLSNSHKTRGMMVLQPYY